MKTIEVSLKDFAIAILRKWAAILLVGVLAGLAFAGSAYLLHSNSPTAVNSEDLVAYEQNLAARRNLIDLYTKQRDAGESYNRDSVLVKADPYQLPTATLTLGVKSKGELPTLPVNENTVISFGESRADDLSRITNRYLILAKNAPLSNLLKDLYPDTQEAYLRELLSVSLGAADILTITAYGPSKEEATKAADAVHDYLKSQQALVSDSVAAHELTLINRQVEVKANPELAEKQIERVNQSAKASNEIAKALTDIKTIEKNKPRLASLQSVLLRDGVVGLIAGLVLAILLFALHYLVRLPMQAPEQAQALFGARYLGGYRRKKGHCLGALADRMAGDYLLGLDDSQGVQIVAASIKEAVKDEKTLLITGSLSEQELTSFAKSLGEQEELSGLTLLVGADLNRNVKTQRELARADGVVVMERLYQSRLKATYQTLHRATQSGKTLLGYGVY